MSDYTQEIPERFRIHYDSSSGVFRILDLWAEDIKNLPPDATIPDNSPAMKILSSTEVNALLGKLKQMGWLEKMFGQQGEQATSIYPKKDVKEIAIENVTKVVELAADFGVSKSAIEAIEKIVNKDSNFIRLLNEDSKGSPELSSPIIEPIKRGPGRPRKEK